MPRVKTDQSAPAAGEQSWQERLAERVRKEKVVPIVSDRLAGDRVLGGYEPLLDAYLAYAAFPLERQGFPEMLQFRSVADVRMRDALAIKEDYINFVKNRLFDLAEAGGASAALIEEVEAQFDTMSLSGFCDLLGFPHFGGREDPYMLLAAFNLPIYITTSCHDFLEKALRVAGKEPRRAICRWHRGIDPTLPDLLDPDFRPSSQAPLVFHLYGIDEIPTSLVLTEDDYLKFLVSATATIGTASDPVPTRIRQAMSDSSLLLLGYHLRSWELRALFWGLVVPRTQKLAGAVTMQVEPSELEKRYLQRYMQEQQFDVFWGDPQTALGEIYAHYVA